MVTDPISPNDAQYDEALQIAEKHLAAALEEGRELDYLVAVMMVETAVNAAAELTSREDLVRLLSDLVRQIEMDIAADQD